MERELLINLLTISIILLEVFWFITDPRSRTDKLKYHLTPRAISVSIFSFIFLSLNYSSGMFFPLPNSPFDQISSILGILIFIGGITISIWAKVTMGKIWGIPAHRRSDQNKLIKTGPFHYTRNPIYIGLIMVLIGYGLALQSYFTFLALLPIIYFWKAAEKEEQLLEKHFKEEYSKYKKEVPRFF